MIAHRVVLRHLEDHEQLAEWHGDMSWTYRDARTVLIGLELLWPRLHRPGVKYYLGVEPIPQSEHQAALVSALLEA